MISVIVPILNEKDNIEPLLMEIAAVSVSIPISEIIYIDDGSTDGSAAILNRMKKTYPLLRVLTHNQRSGQSAALWTGIKAASNNIIVTLDGDGQNNPADIDCLYKTYLEYSKLHSFVMIAGEREKRHDNWVRRLSSRFANYIRSALLQDKTRDTGCSLKMFPRAKYLTLPYFNHIHRFLPALMMRERVHIVQVKVSHRPREHGISKYGTFDRLIVGILDLFGVWWLQRRANQFPGVFEELGQV